MVTKPVTLQQRLSKQQVNIIYYQYAYFSKTHFFKHRKSVIPEIHTHYLSIDLVLLGHNIIAFHIFCFGHGNKHVINKVTQSDRLILYIYN